MALSMKKLMSDSTNEAPEQAELWGDIKPEMTYVITFEEGGRHAGYRTAEKEQDFIDSVAAMLDPPD